jgi:hypothetical protein
VAYLTAPQRLPLPSPSNYTFCLEYQHYRHYPSLFSLFALWQPRMGFMFLVPKLGSHGSKPHLPARYYMLIIFVILFMHFILSITHESYGQATSISRITPGWVKEHSPWAAVGKNSNSASTRVEGDHVPQIGHLPQVGMSLAPRL